MYLTLVISTLLLFGAIGWITVWQRWRRLAQPAPLLHSQERQRLEQNLIEPLVNHLQHDPALQKSFLQSHLAQMPQLRSLIAAQTDDATRYLTQFAERYVQLLDDVDLVEFQQILEPSLTRQTLVERCQQHRQRQQRWTWQQQAIFVGSIPFLLLMLLFPPRVRIHERITDFIGARTQRVELERLSLGYYWIATNQLPESKVRYLASQQVGSSAREVHSAQINYRRLVIQLLVWTLLVNAFLWYIRAGSMTTSASPVSVRSPHLGHAN